MYPDYHQLLYRGYQTLECIVKENFKRHCSFSSYIQKRDKSQLEEPSQEDHETGMTLGKPAAKPTESRTAGRGTAVDLSDSRSEAH